MTPEIWARIGAGSEVVLASGAIYVTALHLIAHLEDRQQEKAKTDTIKNKHKGYADTLRKYASLSTPFKLTVIFLATLAKLLSSLVKVV